MPGSYAILFFIASDFTLTTRHIHNRVSFPLWPSHFILSGAINNCSLFFPSSLSDTFQLEGLIFGVISFCFFILFIGFAWQEFCSSLPFSSLEDHIFSELFTMTHLSFLALYGMVHSFTELYKPPSPWKSCEPWKAKKEYSVLFIYFSIYIFISV